jgi:hypothetical protein
MHVGWTDVRIFNTVIADVAGRQTDVVNILMTSTALGKDFGFCVTFNAA